MAAPTFAQAQAAIVRKSVYSIVAENTSGIVGEWRLGESTGNTVAFDSTNNKAGSYTGSPTLGVTGFNYDQDTAVTFNGSTQYVNIPDHDDYSLVTTGEISFVFWVNPVSTTAAAIIAKGVSAGSQWEYKIQRGTTTPSAGDMVSLTLWQATGSNRVLLQGSAASVPNGIWTHVVVTIKNNVLAALYINGQLNTSSTTFVGTSINGTSNLNIGRRPNNDQYFNGTVDEVSIFNRELTASEVFNLFTAGWGTNHGQAQAQIILATTATLVYGQSQADIKATSNAFAQGQADIKQTYTRHAQALAQIKQTYNSHAQANADIKATVNGFAQAQARIKTTYLVHAHAQGSIKQVYRSYAQAQAWTEITSYRHGQANAYIYTTARGYGQALGTIKTTVYAFGQAQSDIRIVSIYRSGNAQAKIVSVAVYVFGQARAKIGTGILTNLTIIDRDATRLTVIDREPDSNVQLMVSDHEPITMTLIDKNYS